MKLITKFVRLYYSFKTFCYNQYYTHFPKKKIVEYYKSKFGYEPDLKNPRDLNEYIAYQLVYGDISQWHKLADKYRVREYVKKKGYGNNLNELLGVWKNANEIDFSKLTPPYILKTNNASGSNIIVKDNNVDFEAIRKQLNRWLKTIFGLERGERHYAKIKPLIVAEKFLDHTKQDIPMWDLIDYRMWCLNGEPYLFCVDYDHQIDEEGRHKTQVIYKDAEWNDRTDEFVEIEGKVRGEIDVPKPKCFDEMLNMARALCKGFPQVRCDFYVIDNKPIFGEMTFTSRACINDHYSKKLLIEMRNRIG